MATQPQLPASFVDDVTRIIGNKDIEIFYLTQEILRLQKRLNELDPGFLQQQGQPQQEQNTVHVP